MKILLYIMVFFIVGCSSKPILLYSESEKASNNIAILSTSCDKKCDTALKEQLGFDNRYQRNKGLLLEISGHTGKMKTKDGMAFEHSYEIHIEAGEHELVVDHNSLLVTDPPERFKVNLEKGHKYLVARIRVEHMKRIMYRWFPLVFDVTENKVVYANNNYFMKSTLNTCTKKGRDLSFCTCFTNSLDKSLSFKEKEDVIMRKPGGFERLNEYIQQCKET